MTIYHQGATRVTRELPLTQAEREARVQLAACYRIFNDLGWTEMIFNHITLRVAGLERLFLINPFGLHYSEITASNLVLIDIEGNPVRESGPGEKRTCEDVFAAMQRIVDVKDLSYRD